MSAKSETNTEKKVLHFSDGVLEEDDNDLDEKTSNQLNDSQRETQNDSSSWPMVSDVKSSVLWFGTQTLKVCDYLGEGLANFFGITSPKYESEIEEYMRRTEEQKNYESRQLSEFCGWTQTNDNNVYIDLTDIKSIPKDLNSEKQRF